MAQRELGSWRRTTLTCGDCGGSQDSGLRLFGLSMHQGPEALEQATQPVQQGLLSVTAGRKASGGNCQ